MFLFKNLNKCNKKTKPTQIIILFLFFLSSVVCRLKSPSESVNNWYTMCAVHSCLWLKGAGNLNTQQLTLLLSNQVLSVPLCEVCINSIGYPVGLVLLLSPQRISVYGHLDVTP